MSERRSSSPLRWLLEPEPPGLGLDVRSGELAIARLSTKRRPEIDLCLTSPLPEDALRFSLTEPNIVDEAAVRKAIEDALLRAGLGGAKRVALSLPDYVSRLSILELPDAPRSRSELLELVKFRLKKSIPFDVDETRIAVERIPNSTRFFTGVMRESVVSQYEELLRQLDLHPGLVLPASLGLLQLLTPIAQKELSSTADYFFVDVEKEFFSVHLVRSREGLALSRVLGLRAQNGARRVPFDESDLLRDIIPTAIYYREKLAGGALERVYYRSLRPDLTRLPEILEEQFEVPAEAFDLRRAIPIARGLQVDENLADAVSVAAAAALGKAA
jgi:type IV pilus assembly protein PilM